jgi:hypothetical protein
MIDIARESLIRMARVAAIVPDRPSLCTIWRWRTRGVGGRKLETVTIGGRTYTSVEAVARFAHQQGGSDAPVIRTPAARERAIGKAERELSDAGI